MPTQLGPERIAAGTSRSATRDAIILAVLAALVSLAFREVLFQGRVFFLRDFGLFFYPKRALAAEAVRSLRIPMWDSYGGCGEPVLGAYQSAVFYPVALIYYLLPLPASFMWFVVFHFFASGAGAYYMMRTWGARRAGAAFAAVAWALSPAFVSTVDNVSFQTGLAWLPWCLAFTRRIYAGGGFGAFMWLTVTLAMSILAGAPEPVIFIAATVAAYALVRTAALALGNEWSRGWRAGAAVGAAFVFAALVSGVEVAPFLNALKYSARQEPLSAADAGFWSARPRDLVAWLLPRFYLPEGRGGVYWESQYWLKTVYVGALVPLLAAWTVLFVRRRRNWFFAGTAAVFAALALGPHSAVWEVFHRYVPGVGFIRFPVKFYLPAAFALAVLAGFAADDLEVLARRGRRAGAAALVAATAALALACAAAFAASHAWREGILERALPREGSAYAARAKEVEARYASAQWSLGRSAGVLFGGAAALGLAVLAARRRALRPYAGGALLAVLFSDAGILAAGLNPTADARFYTEPPYHLAALPRDLTNSRVTMSRALERYLQDVHLVKVTSTAGLADFLAALKGARLSGAKEILDRIAAAGGPRFATAAQADEWLKDSTRTRLAGYLECEVSKETFQPAMNLLYKVPTPEAFEPMITKWHYNLLFVRARGRIAPERRGFFAYMWGAGVEVDKADAAPGFAYRALAAGGRRARLAERFIAARDDEEAMRFVAYTTLDVTETVVLSRGDAQVAARLVGTAAGGDAVPLGVARVVSDEGNAVSVEVEAARPALVFLSDSWFGLIRATVDGASAPVFRANYAYRAVPVKAGRHTVIFRYVPLDLYAGIAMTLSAVIILAALWYVRKRRGGAGGAPGRLVKDAR